MNKELSDQVNTIERALGECMIETAALVLRTWLGEIGENNPYEEALASIRTRYNQLFIRWQNVDDPEAEATLDKLTGDMYQLVDAVYADLRLKRGLSPQMHGFNPDSPQSVVNYFQNCIHLKPEDLDWVREVIADEQQASTALLAISSLAQNLRECFSIDAFVTLIEGMNAANEMVADFCTHNVLTLLIHYDVRIDFFPQVQDAFTNAVASMDDMGDRVFEILCTLIAMSRKNWLSDFANGLAAFDWLPESVQKLIKTVGIDGDYKTFSQWVPKEEEEYMEELVKNLPNTWLYEVLVSGAPGRENTLALVGVRSGYRDYMWAHPEIAEQVYRDVLRQGSQQPLDFINYAHCLLLKGDRMMAFENYRQARQLSGSLRAFYDLFRPDRRQLIDHGVPTEFVYLMEDNLVNG
ncbi:MAG: hypothetical protein J6T71_00635 [Paludibacteraceae bacterium]|nr:hypothetical protein [Paludibacteraceae bacterium]